MKIREFKKLEKSIQSKSDFSNSYSNINKILYVASIFGHLASIFLGYFLINKIISGAVGESNIITNLSSIVLLTIIELLKRDIFNKFSVQISKTMDEINKDVIVLGISTLLIISVSFYSSIKGAKEFSNKETKIENNMEYDIKVYQDSLYKNISSNNKAYLNTIEVNKIKIDSINSEMKNISQKDKLSKANVLRMNDLKGERDLLRNQITVYENSLKSSDSLIDKKVALYTAKVAPKYEKNKSENTNNSFYFIIISTFIELLILLGVYFNVYFKNRTYTDFLSKINSDTKYINWNKVNMFLEVFYKEETAIDTSLPSYDVMIKILKMNGINNITKNDLTEIIRLLGSINIISGKKIKKITMERELAFKTLQKYFNID